MSTTVTGITDDEAIEQTKHFTRRVAERMSRHDRSLYDDLLQEGRMAAIAAAKAFETGRGLKFVTYAWRRIQGQMADHLRRLSPLTKRERAEARETGQKPFRVFSLSQVNDESPHDFGGTTGTERGWLIDPPHNDPEPASGQCAEFAAFVRRLGVPLSAVERDILRWHYVHGMPQKEIAGLIGLSESRVSQVHISALRRLSQADSERIDRAREEAAA